MHRRIFPLLLVLALVLPTATGLLADDEEERPPPPPPVRPPSADHSGSRESNTWIDLPSGVRVAVGKGVEWQGVRVHLALTWHLVAVDVASGKVLWDRNTSAFWNEVGFKEVETKDGAKVWAVELRPGRRARRGRDHRQYHDLKTGEKLEVPGGPEAPSGTLSMPRQAWDGDQSHVAKGFTLLVTSKEAWKAVCDRLWGAASEAAVGAVDFEKEVVLIVSRGNGWNCDGLPCVGCWEDDARILVRIGRKTYQTMNGGKKTRPWGAYVLPRREKKAYTVERDKQNLIGGPALWTELWRADALPKEEATLKALPPRSDSPHEGWDR